MEILRFENLSKVYGKGENKVVALDNVSFSVERSNHQYFKKLYRTFKR